MKQTQTSDSNSSDTSSESESEAGSQLLDTVIHVSKYPDYLTKLKTGLL